MCNCKSEPPMEGMLLEEDFITIPLSYFEELIRAQTERDILEATIKGDNRFSVEQVLQGIEDAREKRLRCMCISEECGKDEPVPDPAEDAPAEDVSENA